MAAFFITATGTDIGKTFVTAGLIRHLRAQGCDVAALKPVMSGYDPQQPDASDAATLLTALGHDVTADHIAAISPWRYRAPLSPDMAAAREQQSIDVDAVIDFCRRETTRAETVLIEGVGGVMVPLDATRTVRDVMIALACPVVLVTGSYLGAISHTLTARDGLERARLGVRVIVVSESEASSVPLADTVATIARFSKGCAVVALPRLQRPDASHPAFAAIAAALGI